MDLKGVHNFLASLEKKLGEMEIDTTYVDGSDAPQVGDTLRILLPVTEVPHAAITEVMVTDIGEGIDLLMIYSTIVVELDGSKAGELPQKLLDWNMLCPLGSYGIYEEENQLYHKYTIPFDAEMAPEDLADLTMMLLGLIHNILSDAHPTYSAYASET